MALGYVNKNKLKKTGKKRMLVVLIIGIIAFVVIIGRFLFWQLVYSDVLRRGAFALQTRNSEINARRGTIYDRNGKPLAISASASTIAVVPSQTEANKKLSKEEIARFLANTLKLKYDDVYAKIIQNQSYVRIQRKVNKEITREIEEWIDENNVYGVTIEEDAKRYYTNRSLASHVIGYTNSDNVGISGIEYKLDNYLAGTKGKVMTVMDNKQNELPYDNYKRVEAVDGYDVTLTLDSAIQSYAEKALEKAIKENECKNGGVCIVTDPQTGEILAMVSKPDFDLNDPYAAPDIEGIDADNWEGGSEEGTEFLNKYVWRNKAISDTYEPGSTFKAITASAGLEEGVINENTITNDSPLTIAGHTINCWRAKLHGTETFREGVYNSCNPVFVKVAEDLGPDTFYSYVRGFGFYNKTGIMLPGETQGMFHKTYSLINMATLSFGQCSTITPIQLIMAYGAIANGGTLMQPALVKQVTDSEGRIIKNYEPVEIRRVISASTSETMRSILEGVVKEGTGKKAYIQGYRVAGKTGTSETTTSKTEGRYIASFSSFAPADNPRICVLVVLDFPTGKAGHMGGQLATKVAKEIIEPSLDSLEVERQYTASELSDLENVIVPDLKGLTMDKAIGILSSNSYKLKYKTGNEGMDGNTVISAQFPAKGEKVKKGSTITLYGTQSGEENIH